MKTDKIVERNGQTYTCCLISKPFSQKLFKQVDRKIKRNIKDANNTIKKFDLIDIHKTYHSITAECTFCSSELLPKQATSKIIKQVT